MKNIRRSCFETNSSSTHAICIAQEDFLDQKTDDVLSFITGRFGWEIETYSSPEEKASYLFTAILSEENKGELLEKLQNILEKNEVDYRLEFPEIGKYGFADYYIDHSSELQEFLEILDNEDQTMSFLFSSKSYILTGNDNDDHEVEIVEGYPHYAIYKGN